MSSQAEQLLERLRACAGEFIEEAVIDRGELTVEADLQSLDAFAPLLRDAPTLRFTTLIDLCGIDYSAYGHADWKTERATNTGFSRAVGRNRYVDAADPAPGEGRFAVIYHLLSIEHNARLRLRVYAPGEPPTLPSVVEVWPAANWFEREAFDLYGILFEGHPDLRRLLTDYGFIGHPFRKDFPLEGHVEVRYDPARQRVVYQPVSIEPRVLVPRVIRHDHRYLVDVPAEEGDSA